MPRLSECDSFALANLRLYYRLCHPGWRATPIRLGRFARLHGRTITDFGAHSARWIGLFKQGHDDEICWPE